MIRKALSLASLLLLAGCAARQQAPAAVPSPAPVRPAPAPRTATPPPPNFNGLAPDALRARLGTPAFSRKDGTTEMWRYDSGACRVFFFFTANQVSHIETTPEGQGGAPDASCLIALRKSP